MLIIVAETALLLADCSTMNADTADVTENTETDLVVEAGESLTLRDRNRGLSLTLRTNKVNVTESSTGIHWSCVPKSALACVVSGPKVALDENAKVPDLELGVISTADGTGHIVAMTVEHCEMSETCENCGYAGDSENDLVDTEYDGHDQVTNTLGLVWSTLVF